MNIDEKEVKAQYENILMLLKQRRLKEAQTQLSAFVAICNDYSLLTRLEEVKTSYAYMLDYVKRGVEDPTRARLLRQITKESTEICQQVYLLCKDRLSDSYYHQLRRQFRSKSYTPQRWLSEVEECRELLPLSQLTDAPEQEQVLMQRHEKAIRSFFLTTWANSAWEKADAESMQQWLDSEKLLSIDRQLAVSAVTLSLLEYYDVSKMNWLLTACSHQDIFTRQRALVGIFLTLCIHDECFVGNPTLEAHFLMLCDQKEVLQQFSHIALYLIRSLDVEGFSRRMQEEILPEMMKDFKQKYQNLRDKEKRGEEGELDENELMPDWESFTEGKMGEKIREMSQLQMKGADLNYSTFAPMKQHAFFQEPFHWFYPFDPRMVSSFGLSDVKKSQLQHLLDMTLRVGLMCDSDKYSLCFLISSMSNKTDTPLATNGLTRGLMEVAEGQEEQFKRHTERPETVSNFYIQDLYRFYKLSPMRQHLRNPFEYPWRTAACAKLMELTGDFRWVKPLADYLFEQKHYDEAASAYALSHQQADAELCARQGYCYQRLGAYEKAIACYRQADLIQPDHLWTISQLATCHRRMGQYEEALNFYRQMNTMEPDKNSTLYYIGHCNIQLGRYVEALPDLYKLDLQDGGIKAWRLILWCSLQLDKNQQALTYVQRLLNEPKPETIDYLYAGHHAWIIGHEDAAVGHYHKAADSCSSYDEFYQLMQKEYLRLLENKGMTRNDLALLIDASL